MRSEATAGIDLASVDRVLKTTRSVRLRLDLERPVPEALLEEAIDVALQAPTGANSQDWRFVVVTDPGLRARLAEIYRKGSELYLQGKTGLSRTGMSVARQYAADDPRQRRMPAVVKSAVHLIESLARVPVHVIPCIAGSLMLALRARGVASAWTTFTLLYERETAELLGIPDGYTQAALLPVAWLKGGDLHAAPRFPARDVTFWNRWGAKR
jgi:nitroreductase